MLDDLEACPRHSVLKATGKTARRRSRGGGSKFGLKRPNHVAFNLVAVALVGESEHWVRAYFTRIKSIVLDALF